jgi:hypothetical protein
MINRYQWSEDKPAILWTMAEAIADWARSQQKGVENVDVACATACERLPPDTLGGVKGIA